MGAFYFFWILICIQTFNHTMCMGLTEILGFHLLIGEYRLFAKGLPLKKNYSPKQSPIVRQWLPSDPTYPARGKDRLRAVKALVPPLRASLLLSASLSFSAWRVSLFSVLREYWYVLIWKASFYCSILSWSASGLFALSLILFSFLLQGCVSPGLSAWPTMQWGGTTRRNGRIN